MKQTSDIRTFFRYVIPPVLFFALSGVYTIVDGFFVGNSIGDLGLSAYYSIYKAEKKETWAREFTARALWALIISSILLTISIFFMNSTLLRLLGADGELLTLGEEKVCFRIF